MVDYCSIIMEVIVQSRSEVIQESPLPSPKTPSTAHTCSSSWLRSTIICYHLVYAASTSCIILQKSRTRPFLRFWVRLQLPGLRLGLRRSSSCLPQITFPFQRATHYHSSTAVIFSYGADTAHDLITFLFERQWMLAAVRRCYRQICFLLSRQSSSSKALLRPLAIQTAVPQLKTQSVCL